MAGKTKKESKTDKTRVPPPDNLSLNHIKWRAMDIVENERSAITRLISRNFDRRRNIDDECGYTPPEQLTVENDYHPMYEKEGMAKRVVHCLPSESWKLPPKVFETDDEEVTPFEQAFKDLAKTLRGEESSYAAESEEGHPLWEYLERADKLSGIGRYGIILFGVDDGKPLSEPLDMPLDDITGNIAPVPPDPKQAKPKDKKPVTSEEDEAAPEKPTYDTRHKVIYVRCYPERLAQIDGFDTNPNSPRFGKPMYYQLYTMPADGDKHSPGEPVKSERVHWSRVVHIADNLESSETFGTPRQQQVWNRLVDIRKMYGGSAEMYWQGAFPGLSFETHPQLGADVDVPLDDMKDLVEEYRNGLQRFFAIAGLSVKSLAPQVVDPSPQIDKLIEAICIVLAIPKRIFMGSERGELASSQDKDTWNGVLIHRNTSYVTPRIIMPVLDWMIFHGVLPEPAEGYHVEWPDFDKLSPTEEADVMLKKTEALTKYAASGAEQYMDPRSFYTMIMGFTDSEADAIMESTEEFVGIKEEEDALQREEDMQRAKDLGLEAQDFQLDGGPAFGKPQPPVPPMPPKGGAK